MAPLSDTDLPGGLAAGRQPAFSVNALEPPLAGALNELVGSAGEQAEVLTRSLLLAMLIAQVRLHSQSACCYISRRCSCICHQCV